MRILIFSAIVLGITGCASATLVQSQYQPQKGGVVKYKNSLLGGGPSEEKANTIMANFCSPSNYSIIQQQASQETIGYTAHTNGSFNGNNYNGNTNVNPVNRNFTYVQFQCVGQRSTASAGSLESAGEYKDFNSCNDSCFEKYADQKELSLKCYKSCEAFK